MARTQREAIVLILDVGKSVSQGIIQNESTFLELSKSCILRILERKLFVKSKDEIGLVLLGSKETANSLEYENISEALALSIPTWEMLNTVENVVQGTQAEADWLDAVVVAMQLLKDQTEGKKFSEKKIVLFTDLAVPVSVDNIEVIVKGLKSMDIELTVIGPDIIPEDANESDDQGNGFKSENGAGNDVNKTENKKKFKNEDQKAREAILIRIVEETGGVICGLNDALPQLMFYQKKTVKPTPWNVCLDIGPDIKIPVSGYRKIADVPLPSWKVTSNTEESTMVEKERSYFKKDKTTVEKDNVIEGYSFGSTLVPFNAYDKLMMNYQSGEKCFSLLGFTSTSNVPRHLLVGCGVYYFVTQKDKPEAVGAFSALALALESLGMVGVVRRVYNRNNAPYLGILFPKVKPDYQCLVYVELPYSEDVHEYIFPPLIPENKKPTEEQLNSIDVLIDSMDLMNVEQDDSELTEAFHPKRTLIPYHQHFYYSLAHRALHPDAELPPVSKDIMQLMRSPFESKDEFQEALKSIKKQFELTEIKPKPPKRKVADTAKQDISTEPGSSNITDSKPDDLSNMNISDLINPSVVEVGTVKPEHDFQYLLDKGRPFNEVCGQMQKAILNLVMGSFGSDNYPKAQSALKTLRTSCNNKDSFVYNDWLPLFKTNILDRGKDTFWELVSAGKLGLIDSEENVNSSVSKEDAAVFLQVIKESLVETADDDMDTEDLLNEM